MAAPWGAAIMFLFLLFLAFDSEFVDLDVGAGDADYAEAVGRAVGGFSVPAYLFAVVEHEEVFALALELHGVFAGGEAYALFCYFAHVDESYFGELVVVAAEEADGVLTGVDVLGTVGEGAKDGILGSLEFHKDGEVTVAGETGDEEVTGGVGIEALFKGEGTVNDVPVVLGELVWGEVLGLAEIQAG